MKQIVIVTERTDGFQAVYVDGILKLSDDTIYAGELVAFCESDGVHISERKVDLPEWCDTNWPAELAELMRIT